MLVRCLLAIYLLHGCSAQLQPRQEASDILSQVSDVNPDGSFYTKYETANGISYEERGQLKNRGSADEAEEVQGSASWTSKEGEPVKITWQANENGAVFQGDHLPTPPPAPEIPPLIQRALDWIAANPSSDTSGQYRESSNEPGKAPVQNRPKPLDRRPFRF
jgi:hypothetical protein